MYSTYASPSPSSMAASSEGIRRTYPPARNATITGEIQFPYAMQKPAAHTSAPVYEGCRIKRYGPVDTTCCDGCVWILKVKDVPSSRADRSRKDCPAAAVSRPVAKTARGNRVQIVLGETMLTTIPPQYARTRPRPTDRPEPLSRLAAPATGFCRPILYSDHTNPVSAAVMSVDAARLDMNRGSFVMNVKSTVSRSNVDRHRG